MLAQHCATICAHLSNALNTVLKRGQVLDRVDFFSET